MLVSPKKSFSLFVLMVSSSSVMLSLFVLVIFAKPYIMITAPHVFIGVILGAVLLHQGISKLWRMANVKMGQP